MTRRLLRFSLLGFASAVACLLYGWLVEPTQLRVREVALAADTDTLRIGFVSDIHAGGRGVDAERVRRIVETLHAGEPDIILMAGDLMNGHEPSGERTDDKLQALGNTLLPLLELSAPLGVYSVYGNHDSWFGEAEQLYDAVGIPVLDNASVVAGGRLCVFGLADEWTGKPDADVALSCPANLPSIGVMHNPDTAFRLPTGPDLLLAGHTHGGQVNLPILGRVITATEAPRRHAYGWSRVNGTPMFTTAGVGMSVLPVRFRAPPEVVFITLGRDGGLLPRSRGRSSRCRRCQRGPIQEG